MASTVLPRVVVREKQGSKGSPDLRPALPAPSSTLRVESEILTGQTRKTRKHPGRCTTALMPCVFPLTAESYFPAPAPAKALVAAGNGCFLCQPHLPEAKRNLDSPESPRRKRFRSTGNAGVPAAPGLLPLGGCKFSVETRQEGKEGRAIGPCLRRQLPPWGDI